MTGSARDESAWDFFVSYTQADQAWAEWIARLLKEDGYRVLFQPWDMVAGSNWISLMDQGVVRAARMVVVLSPDYLSSVYGTAEWQAAWADDPRGWRRKLIPVRVRGDWPVGLLAGVVGIDLVGLPEDAARLRLRDGIAAAVRGRAKPRSPSPFTGRSGAQDELDLELKSDALHRVAEREFGVRPQQPRVLQTPAVFWDAQQSSLPGRDASLIGRDDELGRLRVALAPAADSPTNRVVVVEGPGGIGKTRLVVEAGRAHTTLIARTGTVLSTDTLVEIPADVPSVIVVDDAHRSDDLSGLAAMVGDPRFVGVTVVLTVRPGLAEPTLRRAGLDHVKPTRIVLDPLGRAEINEIVAAHGITDEVFHLHVIDIAEGNPLIAHTACEIAAQQGTYSWQDTTSVLRDLFKNRLSPYQCRAHISAEEHEHRAAAVALAVLTTAQNGEQLAALVGAVQGLPRDPHRLDGILIDLADAGIVDRPPYTLRPDVLGPVIVADALADGQRVNVDLARTLRVLGRAASWGTGAGKGSGNAGLLGLCRPRPSADGDLAGLHATSTGLASTSTRRPSNRQSAPLGRRCCPSDPRQDRPCLARGPACAARDRDAPP